jgi:hypothetical protein
MDPIRIAGEYGGPRLRDGLVVVFFKQTPFEGWAAEVQRVFEHWRQTVPKDAAAYAAVGGAATDPKPVTARTLSAISGQLDPAKGKKREISTFEIMGPQDLNADHVFSMVGNSEAGSSERPNETNFFGASFPTEWAGPDGEALAKFAMEVEAIATYDSGYASCALLWSTDAEIRKIRRDVASLAFRHPGFDVPDPSETRYELARRCIGANWLTFLGPDLVEELGGHDEIGSGSTDSGLLVGQGAHGTWLRAPGPPQPGDVNRDDDLPELRAMAALLEPVCWFGEESRMFSEPEDFERWQRRFLD